MNEGGLENSESGKTNKFAILKNLFRKIPEKFHRPKKTNNIYIPSTTEKIVTTIKEAGQKIKANPLGTTARAAKAAAGIAIGPGDDLVALGAQALNMSEKSSQRQEFILPNDPRKTVVQATIKKASGSAGGKGLGEGNYTVTAHGKPIAKVSINK